MDESGVTNGDGFPRRRGDGTWKRELSPRPASAWLRCSARRIFDVMLGSVLAVGCMAGCSAADPESAMGENGAQEVRVTRSDFGTTPAGDSVDSYALVNASGMEVRVITYGGIVTMLRVPDRSGQLADVALGFDSLDGYLANAPYLGAIIGRYGNRIANGRFTLDGATYELARNNGPNHLHGGSVGFDKVVWGAEPFSSDDGGGVVLTHTSEDGDEGYPGTLSVRVTYTLTAENELRVDYFATTDRATPVNLTQHTYFNLAGEGSGDVLGHRVEIRASRFTPVDQNLIPTGELAAVDQTPFDFRMPVPIGDRIEADHAQLRAGNGYDHNYVLDRESDGLTLAARVVEPVSGRVLVVSTTEPGMQFYTGNFLDGSLTGKSGSTYGLRSGFCLETQHFPDSPNQPRFPSAILRPGEEYRSTTVFAFDAE